MFNVAIDGPSGAGKSTVAKSIAKQLGYIYVDTGALYRAIGLYCSQKGADTTVSKEVEPLLKDINLELRFVDDAQRVFLNGEDVSQDIRLPEMSMHASNVSAHKCVREFLFDLQRDMAKKNNVIMDGRDIGTVVLPNANVKIFLTASAEIRASRRYKELAEKGIEVTYQEVLDDLVKRDYNDSHREIAPLKQADDAVLVDSSDISFEQTVEKIVEIIRK